MNDDEMSKISEINAARNRLYDNLVNTMLVDALVKAKAQELQDKQNAAEITSSQAHSRLVAFVLKCDLAFSEEQKSINVGFADS